MIVKNHAADGFVARPPTALLAALFYGPVAGLVQERAEKLARSVVPDLGDAFRVADLSEATLAGDGARLFDEAAAIAMLGGRRVVRVRGAGNNLAPLFENFIENPVGDALIVVEAGDLAKNASLRQMFEKDEKCAAVACYPDDAENLGRVVAASLKAEGLAIAPDALEEAAAKLGSDRGVTRRELEKLALYAHGGGEITLEDVRAVLGDEAEARIEEACDAAGAGDFRRLDLALERLWFTGTAPSSVVRAAMGHFQRLALAGIFVARGESPDAAMKRLRPPLHFSRADAFRVQLRRWPTEKLFDALDMLLEAEALCRTTAVPDAAACGRVLMNIAALARPPVSRERA